jgi:hypothetical protein
VLAGCGAGTVAVPLPPEAKTAAATVILPFRDGKALPARILGGALALQIEESDRIELVALSYGCGGEALGTLDGLLPLPYAVHATDPLASAAWEERPVESLRGRIDQRPACPTYVPTYVEIPDTEDASFELGLVVDGDDALAIVRSTGIYRVDRTEARLDPALASLPRAGAVRLPGGEILFVGGGRSAIVSSATVVLAPMPTEAVEASLTADAEGVLAIEKTASGSIAVERFDGTSWERIDCPDLHYTSYPKPVITRSTTEILAVIPTEVDAGPHELEIGAAFTVTGACNLLSTPEPRVATGATIDGVGRVLAHLGSGSFEIATVDEIYIDGRVVRIERDATGGSRGAVSVMTPSDRGFYFGTHFNWAGEYIPGTGFCVLDSTLPSLPVEIDRTDDGFVVLSKGDYDPDHVTPCEQMTGCRPIYVTFVDRTESPLASCSRAP